MRLFTIVGNGCINESVKDYQSIGSGRYAALGALHILNEYPIPNNKEPISAIAVKAACENEALVQEPVFTLYLNY